MNNFNMYIINFHLNILRTLLFIIISFIFLYACGSSSDSVFDSQGYGEVPAIILNIQAEYSNGDSVWRAKGDMIKQLSVVDMIGDENRIFKKGIPGEDYSKQVRFFTKEGTWNIELIDYRGLMRDTLVSKDTYGEYTYRIPIKLDNISPLEILEYMKDLGEGRVIIDKITN